NEGLWPSYNGIETLNPITTCPDPFTGYKVFDRAEWVTAFEFAVYGGTQCQAIGLDWADQMSETRRVFTHNEGRGVEEALLAEKFDAVTALDITPTSPIPLIVALGLLEGH